MDLRLSEYAVHDVDQILTPALLIYPERVDRNIQATLQMVGGDPERWRPHIKTAKLAATVRRFLDHGIRNFKCATSLELLTACREGAADVLLAFPITGPNAERTREIAAQYPRTRVSVLVESSEQAALWRDSEGGIFIDVNPGMDRTGIDQERAEEVVRLAREAGSSFRGLHYYDGHMSGVDASERESKTHAGYDRLLGVVDALASAGMSPPEVITSGTPAAPYGFSYAGFHTGRFIHCISPGTVVYNDFTSLEQLPEYGYAPAVLVLSTVISRPTARHITCDAGHKSVSADAGVPTCQVIGRGGFKPLKPSEEHLPIEVGSGVEVPRIGDKLYLLPRHVCPTVNNFDEALLIVNGRIDRVEPVTARGHESPLVVAKAQATA
jgi:D-serine deaminase-like pyridoxal phosphate-dependent protein